MTVSSSNSRTVYSGNDSVVLFSTVFKFINNDEVLVTLVDSDGFEAVQAETTNYTLSGAGGVGTVAMLVAPATGEKLVVTRNMGFLQEHDYVENDPFPADAHEVSLDILTMQDQQLKEKMDRALVAPIGSTDPYELPTPAAGMVLGWNSGGTDLVNIQNELTSVVGTKTYATTTAMQNDIANLTEGEIHYVSERDTGDGGQSWWKVIAKVVENNYDTITGNATLSFQLLTGDIVESKSIGAIGDGIVDDTDALDQAETYQSIYLSAGTYEVTTKRDTSKYYGEGVISVNGVVQPTSKGRSDNICGNLLSNTKWQVRTGLSPITIQNHQATGGLPAMSVSSYTTGSNTVVCTTADTSQYKVGDLVTFSGGCHANMKICSSKIEALVVDTSFTVSLPHGALGTSSAACSVVGIQRGDIAASTGSGPDGWTKTSSLSLWVDENSENAYNNSLRQIGLKKTTAGSEYFYHKFNTRLDELRGQTVVFGGGGMHKIKGGSNTWRAMINCDGTGGGLTVSPPAEGTGYEWCEVFAVIPEDATYVDIGYQLTGDIGDAYFVTHPMSAYGSFLGDWNYAKKSNEYLIPIVKYSPDSWINASIAVPASLSIDGVTYGLPLRFDAETNGVMSADIPAISMQLECRSLTADEAFGLRDQEAVPHKYGILTYSKVTSMMEVAEGILTLDSGHGFAYSATSAAAVYNCSIDINGFQL